MSYTVVQNKTEVSSDEEIFTVRENESTNDLMLVTSMQLTYCF